MSAIVESIEALEARVGTRPPTADLKVIDHLDTCARQWLAASPLAFCAFSDERRIDVTLAGGAPGFAESAHPGLLEFSRQALDDPQLPHAGQGVGLLFLIPGIGETLRVNGTVKRASAKNVTIDVRECYGHCAKALLRSDFWHAPAASQLSDANDCVLHARLMGLATADARGQTDLSPKGDPAGLLVKRIGDDIVFADRPGNRRTDSLRNLLDRPEASAVLVIPGSTRLAYLRGQTQLSADPALCAQFAVQQKIPHLVIRLITPEIIVRDSLALHRTAFSTHLEAPAHIDPPKLFTTHIRLNRTRGVTATLTKAAVVVPGLVRRSLEKDYKKNLY